MKRDADGIRSAMNRHASPGHSSSPHAGLRVFTLALLLMGPSTLRASEQILGLMGDSPKLPWSAEMAQLGNQRLARLGWLDVTAAPFSADGGGVADCTSRLQEAINFAREHQLAVFFPSGVYRVSNTLECIQTRHDPVTQQPAPGRKGRDWPCVLVGEHTGKSRPRILLAPQSAGFADPSQPKNVVHYWARAVKEGLFDDSQPNINMNQVFCGIDIEIGPGNPGAVAIYHRAAQGSTVQDCTFDVTHGYCGLAGGAGSGGSHAGITVIGGRIGIDYRETQPAPTLTGVTLLNQTETALVYQGRQALSAVGLRIITRTQGPVITCPESRAAGNSQVCLVDSEIVFEKAGANVAVEAGASLVMDNVYVRGAQSILRPPALPAVRGNSAGWLHVRSLALGIDTVPLPSAKSPEKFPLTMPIYVDGTRLADRLLMDLAPGQEPPTDLQSRHLWGAQFPNFQDAGAAIVTAPPYRARGDGVADDTDALQKALDENDTVFLPRGQFAISRPLVLRPQSRLIGVGRSFSRVQALRTPGSAFAKISAPLPMVQTPDDPDAHCIIAFIQIEAATDTPLIYPLEWRCGRLSILREVEMRFPYGWREKATAPPLARHPAVVVRGHGGGRWYNFNIAAQRFQSPEFRLLLIEGTSEPLRLYQCNPEYGRGASEMEIRRARHVTIFGLKSEGNEPVLTLRDSAHIRVFGYGGNASAFAGKSLFLIERCSDYLLANLIDSPRNLGSRTADESPGEVVDPKLWHMVAEQSAADATFRTAPCERPVLLKCGHPAD